MSKTVRVTDIGPEDPRHKAVLDEFTEVFGWRVDELFRPSWWGVSGLDGEVFLGVGEIAMLVLANLSANPNAVTAIEDVIEDGPRPLRPLEYRSVLLPMKEDH